MTSTAACEAQSGGVTARLILCVGSAALAGLLFGFDTAVISGTTTALARTYNLDSVWLGVTVSAALWGTLAGAMLAGRPGDRYGSRTALRAVAILFVLGAIGSACAWDWGSFVLFRIVTGLAVGSASVLAPVYIAEVAPARHRGALIVLFQLNIILGILLAYCSNAAVGVLDLGASEWRWKLAVGAAPALVLQVLLISTPQSPRWLLGQGRATEARRVLVTLGRSETAADTEVEQITAGLRRDPTGERLSWRHHARPIMLAILIAGFNQLSGINALLYYLNDIFAAAGGGASTDAQAIVIGIANGVFTCIGLVLIDRAGRKTLLAIGSGGMAICLAVAGLALDKVLSPSLLLWSLIGFIAFFASSSGAVIWVYLSEIFPTAVRSRGAALGASVHWGADAIIAGVFPAIASLSAGRPFLFFAAMMLVQLVVVLRYFPETKRSSLEAIGDGMGQHAPPRGMTAQD